MSAPYALIEGERVEGTVVRVPRPGAVDGNSLILACEQGVRAIPATAKRGATVLERQLKDLRVRPGDRVAVTYVGKRRTQNGEREYRMYAVEVISS